MKSKKGMIEVQLNWIFVLIAGALILLFFVAVVVRQRYVSESGISYNVLTKIKSFAGAAGVTSGTTDVISIPETEIKWDCPSKSLAIEGASSVAIPIQVFFAPNIIKGRKLIIWTQEWRVPFFVTNFLFLTSPEVRYIFVYNSDPKVIEKAMKETRLINKTLPEEMNIEIVDEDEFKDLDDKNNYAVKVILLGFDDEDKSGLLESNDIKNIVSGVQYDNNDVFFYEEDEREETKYIKSYDPLKKDPSYYAAIFADSKESYDCMMKTAFRRLDKIKEIYGKRVERLGVESRKDCRDYYTDKIIDKTKKVDATISDLIFSLASGCSEEFPDCGADIGVNASMIFSVNEGLTRRSCPLIY